MRHTRYDGADIRRILAAMVTDNTVCGRISSQWPQFGLFKSDHANLIGGWCVDHFKQYGSAPNQQLTSLFEEWAGEHPTDNDLSTSVERFLDHLSDEHEQKEDVYTSDYLINLASKHFNKIRLEKTIDQAQLELDQGNVEDAQNQLTRSKPIELGLGSYIEPADDYQVWDDAFSTERRRPLVTYPGALGKYFGGTFNRGELYAFLASDKCGKTTWLVDFAYRVIRKRNKVVFFDTGDGDQDEVITRLGVRSSAQSEYSVKTKIPIEWIGDNLIANTIQCRSVNPMDAYRSFIKISKASDTFRVSCHANSTISVEGIDSILERWSHDNWLPACCIIDYADILAPPSGVKDKLDKIDETWKQLRRLSQQRHCLVMTATQASALIYGRERGFLGKQHFSGRKTINAVVNGMVGINVSDKDRARQEARLKWIVQRKVKNRMMQKNFVTVAGCYDIGNPIIISK